MSKKIVFAALVVAILPWADSFGQTITTYTDDFSTAHNYSMNGVPGFNSGATSGSAIWEGIHNQTGHVQDAVAAGGTLGIPMVGPANAARAWENAADTGFYLWRKVNVEHLQSITVDISSQPTGFWSLTGPLIRNPTPPAGNSAGDEEAWIAGWSFKPSAGAEVFQANSSHPSFGEDENSSPVTAPANLKFIRLIHPVALGYDPNNAEVYPLVNGVPSRRFILQASPTGLDGSWIPAVTPNTPFADPNNLANFAGANPDLASGMVEVGITAWSTDGALATPVTQYNSVTIVTNTGLPPLPERTDCIGDGRCSWVGPTTGNLAFSFFGTNSNWADTTAPIGAPVAPSGNNVVAVFPTVAGQANVTVVQNATVTLKGLEFNSTTTSYVLGGGGQINLQADTGSASIAVLNGNHQIQLGIDLLSNTTASAVAGSSLQINGPVDLNNNTLTITAGSNIALNHGVIRPGTLVGPGSGSGSGGGIVNEGELGGLASLAGDLTQMGSGSLDVVVGGAPISVSGSAVLDGVLNVSLADGFSPVSGQTYTVLTAGSLTDMGLSLGGSAAGMFQLAIGAGSIGLTAIPEPGSMTLVAFGLAACGLAWRRRRGNEV